MITKPFLPQAPRFSMILLVGFSVFLLAAGPAALADDPPPRVSYLDGTAAYEPAGDVDWTEVTINLPLLTGDRIFTHPDSRLELELGYENFLRLSAETDVILNQATGSNVVLTLALGDVILRIRDGSQYQVQTPAATIQIGREGLYRLKVFEDGETHVAVRKGRAEVANSQGDRSVRSGEELVLAGPQSGLQNVLVLSHEDGFDLWSDRRDASHVNRVSVSNIGGTYVQGAHDLDYYGYWDAVDTYGNVWFPHVSVGWVPYRTGRWLHYPHWGWTWISYEPWGWLPYHHGRWVYHRPYSRWGWVPGISLSVWSPSLVNFYFGAGYVGWTPRGYGRGTIINDNSVTVINNNNVVVGGGNNWDRRYRENGLTVVRESEFGRVNPERNRVERLNGSVVQNFREGLPSQLSSPVARNRTTAAGTPSLRSNRSARSGGNALQGAAASSGSNGWQSRSRSNRLEGSSSSSGRNSTPAVTRTTGEPERSAVPGRSFQTERSGQTSRTGSSPARTRVERSTDNQTPSSRTFSEESSRSRSNRLEGRSSSSGRNSAPAVTRTTGESGRSAVPGRSVQTERSGQTSRTGSTPARTRVERSTDNQTPSSRTFGRESSRSSQPSRLRQENERKSGPNIVTIPARSSRSGSGFSDRQGTSRSGWSRSRTESTDRGRPSSSTYRESRSSSPRTGSVVRPGIRSQSSQPSRSSNRSVFPSRSSSGSSSRSAISRSPSVRTGSSRSIQSRAPSSRPSIGSSRGSTSRPSVRSSGSSRSSRSSVGSPRRPRPNE